ncbi:MAG TPA: CAP domain-containing protein [Solirubrobacterales bacterium]|nr:CAP domain-containing protein [Solirubrobacterales bacterium]
MSLGWIQSPRGKGARAAALATAFAAAALCVGLLLLSTPALAPADSNRANRQAAFGSVSVAELEIAVLCETNARRVEQGLPPLIRNEELSASARGHAADMLKLSYLAHESRSGTTPTSRAHAAGYPEDVVCCGENIAGSHPHAKAVVDAWMNSPGHRKNILRTEYREIGIGIAGPPSHFVQVFAEGSTGEGITGLEAEHQGAATPRKKPGSDRQGGNEYGEREVRAPLLRPKASIALVPVAKRAGRVTLRTRTDRRLIGRRLEISIFPHERVCRRSRLRGFPRQHCYWRLAGRPIEFSRRMGLPIRFTVPIPGAPKRRTAVMLTVPEFETRTYRVPTTRTGTLLQRGQVRRIGWVLPGWAQ